MKITFKILLTSLLVILPGLSYGQGYISSDYIPCTTGKLIFLSLSVSNSIVPRNMTPLKNLASQK